MDIQRIATDQIDKIKWNSCVHYASNGNVFGYLWYLNNVVKDWEALVEGDYESVFPLIWRQDRLKRKVIYQPPLIREAGPYTINALSPKRIRNLLEAIPPEYKKIEMQLSERITLPKGLDYKSEEKINNQLLLMDPYESIESGYHPHIMQQIDEAHDRKLRPNSNLKPEVLAAFYKKHTPAHSERGPNFHAFQRIMYNALHRGWGFISGIETSDKTLCAVGFFIYSHNKMLSLLEVASPLGQESGALAFMYDLIIRSNANKPLILDFNSSGPNPLAKELGAIENIYYRISLDRRRWKVG